jgi:hypothetical protein
VDDLGSDEAPTAIEVLVGLAESAPDFDLLGALAAGPISELLYAHAMNHWSRWRRLLAEAPPFARRLKMELAFGGWLSMPDEVRRRLEKFMESPRD